MLNEMLARYFDAGLALGLAIVGLLWFARRMERVLDKFTDRLDALASRVDRNTDAQNATATAVLRLLESQGKTTQATMLSKDIHATKRE